MSTPRPVPLVFLFGLSDTGKEAVMLEAGKGPVILVTGTCSYEPQLTPGRFAIQRIWLDGSPQPQNLKIPGAALVNYIADPDSHSQALTKAIGVVDQIKRPCFNPPQLVAQTRRDEVAQRLAGIPGLRVPRTLRFVPHHPLDFPDAVKRGGLTYPVLVRLAGDHGGVSMVKVDTEADWDAIHQLPWGGRAAYLTEFVDYRDPDGLYRKQRIVLVRGMPFLRHVIIGSDWLLHVHKRRDTPELMAEETQRLENFERALLPQLGPTLGQINARIGLDFFGIDCHVAADGTMTLFEANATMSILVNRPSADRSTVSSARMRVGERIRARLEDVLVEHAAAGALRLGTAYA